MIGVGEGLVPTKKFFLRSPSSHLPFHHPFPSFPTRFVSAFDICIGAIRTLHVFIPLSSRIGSCGPPAVFSGTSHMTSSESRIFPLPLPLSALHDQKGIFTFHFLPSIVHKTSTASFKDVTWQVEWRWQISRPPAWPFHLPNLESRLATPPVSR